MSAAPDRDNPVTSPVPARVVATQQRRTSGAAGTHGDRRTKRNRTRGDRKRRAIADQQ